MRVKDLQGKNIVVWGTGKEGLAAAAFVRAALPAQAFVFVDEGKGPDTLDVSGQAFRVVRSSEGIEAALSGAQVVIKSPGVSLYHPLLEKEQAKPIAVTSLLNLWFAEKGQGKTVCVTGTKGKSTTSALLAHALTGMGKKSVLLGNIGTPVTEGEKDADVFVIEVSSYQAANFSGICDVGILTSLYPEHLDWHRTLEVYYRDKANLLAHSRQKIAATQACETLADLGFSVSDAARFDVPEGVHFKGDEVYDGPVALGTVENAYLLRSHNRKNVCCVLQAIKLLGFDAAAAIKAMKSFQGLPHRQHELGEKEGILYVDDSISTTPQSAIAAMEVYQTRPLTLIAGGFDRDIDYSPLVQYVLEKNVRAVVCLGESGKRIHALLKTGGMANAFLCASMREAVQEAKNRTPWGGAILLSPAAPSYGMFKNYIDRAASFAVESGFD